MTSFTHRAYRTAPGPLLPVLLVALACAAALAAGSSAAQTAAGHLPLPVTAFAPVLAGADGETLVLTAYDPRGRERVFAAGADGIRPLGPAGGGFDGAPAVAASDGAAWVVASRTRARSLLWARRRRAGRWGPLEPLPPADAYNHHPAVAARADVVWVAWVAGSGGREHLYASRWRGTRWSAPEPLPEVPGEPMAPAIAVDTRGRPAVAFAASDGQDAEIWWVRRRRGAWSRPERLSDDRLPDILPSIAFAGSSPLVVWSSHEGDAYYPVVRAANGSGRRWGPVRLLAPQPGSAPQLAAPAGADSAALTVAWAEPGVDGTSLHVAVLGRDGRPRAERLLARAASARFRLATGADGAPRLAWHEAGGIAAVRLGVADDAAAGLGLGPALRWPVGRAGPRPGGAPDADAAGGRRLGKVTSSLTLPGTYRAFGDSITLGLVRFDGVVSFTDGYPGPLAEMIEDLIGTAVTVVNDGVGGELSSEGLARLRSLHASSPKLFTFLMEGTNDVSNLVDAEVITANLRSMVQTVHGTDRIAVVANLLPRRTQGFGGSANARTDEANAAIEQMVLQERAVFVDQHALFVNKGKFYSDSIHPNEDGYRRMAGGWFVGIEPILKALLEQQEIDGDRERDAAARRPTRQRGR